jgi:tetratricopeptide (TPR) repeat protein
MNTIQKFVPGLRMVGCLLLVALMLSPVGVPAVEAVAETSTNSNDALRSYLVLQEQLRATQQALEQNRKESEDLAAKNAAALEIKLQELKAAMNGQRSAEWESMQKTVQGNNRLMLIVSGSIAGVGFFVLLVTGYLQWRSVTRLAEVSAQVQGSRLALPAAGSASTAQLLGEGETSQSNGRLFGALTQLEKRIKELEHSAHVSVEAKALTAGTGTNGSGPTDLPTQTQPEASLLARGQSLLETDQAVEALGCFDEILKTEPNHGEALVKKGLALEALQRADEALACYDRAIAANADLTIAFLQKGGLLNRLERYEEALQCYELALHAQEKAHAA